MRSRGAILEVLNGPDGIAGTSDDYDALLFSGNSGAGTPAKAGYAIHMDHRGSGRFSRSKCGRATRL